MTHYRVLGVAPTATPREVRAAYLQLARRYHPDAGGSHERMREVNEAWAVLGEARSRRAYDLGLGLVLIGGPDRADDGAEDPIQEGDLADDQPLVPTPPGHGAMAVAPVALFALSLGIGIFAMMFTSRVLLGAAFATFAVSAGLMVAVPLLELTRGSRLRRR